MIDIEIQNVWIDFFGNLWLRRKACDAGGENQHSFYAGIVEWPGPKGIHCEKKFLPFRIPEGEPKTTSQVSKKVFAFCPVVLGNGFNNALF